MQPLKWSQATDSPGQPHSESCLERVLSRLPLLEPWALCVVQATRPDPIIQQLDDQLLARGQPDHSVWGNDPRRVALGLLPCDVARQEMGWPSDAFIPEDPFDVVFCPLADAPDRISAMMEIEERLEIEIED